MSVDYIYTPDYDDKTNGPNTRVQLSPLIILRADMHIVFAVLSVRA